MERVWFPICQLCFLQGVCMPGLHLSELLLSGPLCVMNRLYGLKSIWNGWVRYWMKLLLFSIFILQWVYHYLLSVANVLEFSWILRILKQCYKHKRGIPPNFKSMELGPATPAMTQPTPANTSTLAEPELAPGASGSASTTTLPLLETEFLAELDLGGTQLGAGPGADGIDWDALVGDGDWLMNLSGWNDPLIDGQLPPDQQILQQQSLR